MTTQTREITTKQLIFLNKLIEGKSQREAYKIAYPTSNKWKENSIDSKASQLLKNAKVMQRYQEMQEIANQQAIMTAAERKKWLTSIIFSDMQSDNKKIGNITMNDKLKALDILNKMSGDYIEKHEVQATMSIEDILKNGITKL